MAKNNAVGQGISRRQFVKTSIGVFSAVGAGALSTAGVAQSAPSSAARELVVGINADPDTLDTRTIVKTQAMAMHNHVCQALLMRDAKGELHPWLAESWQQTSPTEIVFKLRSGVKFTNGESFDADAVKWTYDNFLVPGMYPSVSRQKQDWLRSLDRVQVVDKSTVRFVLKYPSNAFMMYVPFYSILPPAATKAMGNQFAFAPIGTGPYKMGEYVRSSHLSLVANPDCWSGRPKTERLTFRFIPEDATRMAALQAGEVSMANNIPPDFATQLSRMSTLQVKEIPAARSMYVYILCNQPPFNKQEARKALSLAINRRALVSDAMGGHATLGGSPWSPAVRYHDPSLQPDPYDLPKAKQLLAAAGYDGKAVKFGFPTGMWLNDKIVAEFLLSAYKDLGLNVNAETLDFAAYYSNEQKHMYNLQLQSYGILTLHPDFFVGAILTKTDNSLILHDDQKIFDLIAAADRAPDERTIQKNYFDLQREIVDYAPLLTLYYFPYIVAQSTKLRGYDPRPDEHFFFWDATLTS